MPNRESSMKFWQDFRLWATIIRNSQESRQVRIGVTIFMLCIIGFGVSIVQTFVSFAQAYPLGLSSPQPIVLPPATAFWLSMLAIFTCGAIFSRMLWNTPKEK